MPLSKPLVFEQNLRGNAMQPSTNEMFNEDQAAQFLGVSVRTIQSWRVTGSGCPYVKLGRSVRYQKAKLIDWIEQNTRAHTSEGAGK
jgi:excisionase family DNA binding protein